MEIIYKPLYKAVVYAGEEIYVPDWVGFIATNSDGGIWGYSERPTFIPNQMFDPKTDGGGWRSSAYKTILGYAKLGDTAPENSLMALSQEASG